MRVGGAVQWHDITGEAPPTKPPTKCLGASIVAALPVGLWAGRPLKPQASFSSGKLLLALHLLARAPP